MVGGGKVAERKIEKLVKARAVVTVISPEITVNIKQLVEEKKVYLEQRMFQVEDVSEAFLVIAATNNREINQQIFDFCHQHQLVNIVDDPEHSNFTLPSTLKCGRLTISVSTAGASPGLSKKIVEQLSELFDAGYEEYVDFLYDARMIIKREVDDEQVRRELFSALLHKDFVELTKKRHYEKRQRLLQSLLSRKGDHGMRPGTVYLVGAGPGDIKLITVYGLECIKKADVIAYDRLINEELLKFTKEGAELIFVGKSPGRHALIQEEIHDLLVGKALEGKIVTRLKGGDPCVFGRAGEEAEVLARHHIPFEIVPGVTSGIAAPAYAGIPVTHRDHATSFTIVTGHGRKEKGMDGINWQALAQGSDTIAFYMGVGNLPLITNELIQHGKSPTTPVAVIQWGTTERQKTVTGDLSTIQEVVLLSGITHPAIILVGEVVRLREKINWFEEKVNPVF